MLPDEHAYLKEALYLSIHVSGHGVSDECASTPDRALLDVPPFRRTHEHWGRAGDKAVVAATLDDGRESHVGWPTQSGTEWIIGAAWVRLYGRGLPTYGFVSEDIPVLVVALEAEYRDQGIGTELMNMLIQEVRRAGMPGISLSVDPTNRAMSFYRKLGFKALDEPPRVIEDDRNPVMLLEW